MSAPLVWNLNIMRYKRTEISEARKARLEAQGFTGYSRVQLNNIKWGVRLAYISCVSIVIAGLIGPSIEILAIALTFAFFGTVLPNHPFDYAYNYGVRYLIQKPMLPVRPNQSRFACALATLCLAVVIFAFSRDMMVLGYVIGLMLVSMALLVSITDFCVPSLLYNACFVKPQPEKVEAP